MWDLQYQKHSCKPWTETKGSPIQTLETLSKVTCNALDIPRRMKVVSIDWEDETKTGGTVIIVIFLRAHFYISIQISRLSLEQSSSSYKVVQIWPGLITHKSVPVIFESPCIWPLVIYNSILIMTLGEGSDSFSFQLHLLSLFMNLWKNIWRDAEHVSYISVLPLAHCSQLSSSDWSSQSTCPSHCQSAGIQRLVSHWKPVLHTATIN
jgi:hypothetical protein